MEMIQLKNFEALNSIANHIFEENDEVSIISDLIIEQAIFKKFSFRKKPSDLHKNMRLIYLLLDSGSLSSQVFWDAYAIARSSNVDQNFPLSLDQISELLELTNTDNNKKLYDDLKFFISTNGLVKQASKNHITSEEITEASSLHGSIAFTHLSEGDKKKLIETGKEILLHALILLEGWCPLKFNSSNLSDEVDFKHSKKLLDSLKKHGLIKSASKKSIDKYNKNNEILKNPGTSNDILEYANYIRTANEVIADLKKLAGSFEIQDRGASSLEVSYNFSEHLDFKSILDLSIKNHPKVKNQSLIEMLNEYSNGDFKKDYLKKCQEYREKQKGSAKDYLEKKENDKLLDLDLLESINPALIIIDSIKYLISSINARIAIIPGVQNTITAQELALIAKLDTYRTVINDGNPNNKRNEENKKREKLEKVGLTKKERTLFTSDSARKWLQCDSRKFPYRLRSSLNLSNEFTSESLKDIYKAFS